MDFRAASAIWPIVHSERVALFQDLQGLQPQQWQVPSLCPGWNIHEVLAHLVDTAKTTRLGFVRGMIAAGFDFDRENDAGIRREWSPDPEKTLAAFGEVLLRQTGPPVPRATRLVEVFAHGEDIRRPLGISRRYPSAAVLTALEYQLKTSVKIGGGREHARGWRLMSSHGAFERGEGPTVSGTPIALLLAVSGRPVAVEELDGPGAAAFVRQLR